jgi:hypothetical protein
MGDGIIDFNFELCGLNESDVNKFEYSIRKKNLCDVVKYFRIANVNDNVFNRKHVERHVFCNNKSCAFKGESSPDIK